MDEFLQLLLSGPMSIVIPFIITCGLVWVIYYFVFPIMEKNGILLKENEKLNQLLSNDIKQVKAELSSIHSTVLSSDNKKILEELEDEINRLMRDYPKIEGEISKVISKVNEMKEYFNSSRRNIDNTAQIIGILKSLESLERSIEIIKERQITQAGVLSNISNNMSSTHLNLNK